ncbi:MAG: fimbrillin family protein [Rikenellaceae bacterium]
MKKIKYLLLTLALCVGCCEDESDGTAQSGDEVQKGSAVEFAVELASATDASVTALDADTPVVFKQSLDVADYIGVTALSGGEVSELNTKYFCNGDGTTIATVMSKSICYPLDGSISAVAYSPYDADFTYESGLTLNIADQTDLEVIDLLYSNVAADLTDSGEAVDLTFSHLLTAIIFKIEAGEGVEESELADVTFTIEGLNTEAIVTFGEEPSYTLSKKVNIVMNTTDTPGYAKALVFPEYITNSTVYLSVTYAGGEVRDGLKLLLGGGNSQLVGSTVRGNTLTISRDGVTFSANADDSGNTIIDWNEVDADENENDTAYEIE